MQVNGGFPKLGVLFWGSYNKDYSILAFILGSPYFGKLPNHARCLLSSSLSSMGPVIVRTHFLHCVLVADAGMVLSSSYEIPTTTPRTYSSSSPTKSASKFEGGGRRPGNEVADGRGVLP